MKIPRQRRRYWTVVGCWVEDEPVPVAVIAGHHLVHGGHDAAPWATFATAATPAEAEQLGIADMRTRTGDVIDAEIVEE